MRTVSGPRCRAVICRSLALGVSPQRYRWGQDHSHRVGSRRPRRAGQERIRIQLARQRGEHRPQCLHPTTAMHPSSAAASASASPLTRSSLADARTRALQPPPVSCRSDAASSLPAVGTGRLRLAPPKRLSLRDDLEGLPVPEMLRLSPGAKVQPEPVTFSRAQTR